ncbi:MAG: Phospho-2-dehydro-3-deoxyheptonate aldolase, Tyr-sensitive [Candidatus Omnitrophica bacterium]|nr:Phospho-2-dehydro-3-deoxyheptonate aldolase, Tyr-sensitive [Candidatus Omnitrophota bacterium]
MKTYNLRVSSIEPLPAPLAVKSELPLSEELSRSIAAWRQEIVDLLTGKDRRLLVIVGPCSIHDTKAALEYADRLAPLRKKYQKDLNIVMRVYFEKPRTTVGWKGLINDPHLDGSCDVQHGLPLARKLLLDIAHRGIPAANEALDPVTPQYIFDLIAWAAIGARTTESQTHREMASGLSMPVGFKNGTDGSLGAAINAIEAASHPHSFTGMDEQGRVSVIRTTGNPHGHIVLRGGSSGPNFDPVSVNAASEKLSAAKLNPRVLVDCSHANSNKNHNNQPLVVRSVADQIREGSKNILGVMIESHLVAGRQDFVQGKPLTYGQSITDACIDFATTEKAVAELAEAVAGIS